MRYTLNDPFVIADVIEDEAIILNMQTGKYYSLQNSGLKIWQLLVSGYTRDEALALLAQHYQADAASLAQAIDTLLAMFTDNDLLRTTDSNAPKTVTFNDTKLSFTQPEVAIYTDLEELLLIDPIHEVEDMGWPQKKAD